jgi:hydroxymethylbilane synthase
VTGSRALRLATRGSPLALWQAGLVAQLVGSLPGSPGCEVLVVRTTGDRLAEVPIARIGGQGAFVKEVSAAVMDGRAEMAVHSAKDLPSEPSPGLVLAAVPERGDPRDAMVGARLDALPAAATVATGSVRRRVQLSWLRPDLTFCELRGNMHTRVERAERAGAGVLSMAGLQRLGLGDRVTEVLDPSVVVPQVGQGAIAVECRESDSKTRELLAAVDDDHSRAEVSAERAFLATLGSGCSLPCGALATTRRQEALPRLVLEGMMASRDGHVVLRRSCEGHDPDDLGRTVARALLDDAGGSWLGDWNEEVPA